MGNLIAEIDVQNLHADAKPDKPDEGVELTDFHAAYLRSSGKEREMSEEQGCEHPASVEAPWTEQQGGHHG